VAVRNAKNNYFALYSVPAGSRHSIPTTSVPAAAKFAVRSTKPIITVTIKY